MAAPAFLPEPVSDYDGFGFADPAAAECPDCGTASGEFEHVNDLLAWIDAHIPACKGWGADERGDEL